MNDSNASQRIDRTKVILGFFTLLGILGAPLIVARCSSARKTTEGHTPTITFSGRVSDDTGKAILGATVIATIDQSVGQPIRTDANGQFQIEIPAEAKSLRLNVNADGYSEMPLQVNIHRTGPEEIHMQRIPAPVPVTPSQPKLKPQPHAAVPDPSATPPAQVPAPSQNICGPGVVNCNFAPNQGHQDTYYGVPQPPPKADFAQTPIQPLAFNSESLRGERTRVPV